jgi:hypothetical protein
MEFNNGIRRYPEAAAEDRVRINPEWKYRSARHRMIPRFRNVVFMKGHFKPAGIFCLRSAAQHIYFLAIIAVFSSVVWNCPETYGADVSIKPSVTLREDYDDNIFLTRDNREYDFITKVIPSVSITYKTPIWDLRLNETFYWWYYAKSAARDYSNDADITSKLAVIKNLLYFDATDRYSSAVLNPRGASTTENLIVNRSDTNAFNASPYVKYQLDPATAVTAGYAYTNIWYRNSEGINRQQHKGYLSIQHAFNPKVNILLGAEYVADRPENKEPDNDQTAVFSDNDQTAVFSTILYTIDPRTSLEGTAGYRMFAFANGADHNKLFYDLGIVYQLPQKGKIELRASQLFGTSPTQGIVETILQKLTVSYGEAFSVSGSVYHSKNNYPEVGLTDEATGFSAGFAYAPNPRRTYRVSGGYERDTYQPQGENRKIYLASFGIDHRLTAKMSLNMTYAYNKSTGQLEENNYTDNTVLLQLRIEI